MTDDRIRNMFELWYRENSLTSDNPLEFSNGHYLNTWVNRNWDAYKRGQSDIKKKLHTYSQSKVHSGCIICGYMGLLT